MKHLKDLLQTAQTWPLFVERHISVMENLVKLQPPALAAQDLPIAYAMTIWPDVKCDWRSSVKA